MTGIILEKSTKTKNANIHVPRRYLPRNLTKKDLKMQRKNLVKSRKLYKKGVYYQRPVVKSFTSKESPHIRKARKMYNIEHVLPNKELATKTKCSVESLEKIVNKGRGAYYSSGSRPNQTAESWGLARLASSITGGNASVIDYNILHDGCENTSPALKLAKKSLCEKKGKCG